VNRAEKQVFQGRQGSAPFWQDKHAQMRVPAASGQPSPVAETAREEQKVLNSQYLEQKSAPKQHSTKRQTVQAAGWIDPNTNIYIVNRLAESRKLIDPKFTRSKVIAEMLKERAADDTFFRSQAILAPLIQDVMRAEFRSFTNRFMGLLAKIAYQVGWILSLLIRYMSLQLNENTLHTIEQASEKDGRVSVARRTPQTEEVKDRIRSAIEQD
jgi:hypothetical protein